MSRNISRDYVLDRKRLMRIHVLAAAFAGMIAASSQADAQRYFVRAVLPIPKTAGTGTPATPKPVAKCGALVKGDWFEDIQKDTGLTAQTLGEAQSACDSLATKGAGTCGWTGEAYYDSKTRYRVFWTQMVKSRTYNTVPWNGVGYVWAAECPAS
jgi:hypothetical protein